MYIIILLYEYLLYRSCRYHVYFKEANIVRNLPRLLHIFIIFNICLYIQKEVMVFHSYKN